ncbi:hypothetical protein NDU88_007715 [Pleurodeles waltl]|uniref:Secreted protein n=1 Tax=Pleurodeles waltl TaxID=8319 RepID=A0AAV7N2U4_PLEWA|nr:hypothetical protein NDU88_007715 [Pleurodeles waltl]
MQEAHFGCRRRRPVAGLLLVRGWLASCTDGPLLWMVEICGRSAGQWQFPSPLEEENSGGRWSSGAVSLRGQSGSVDQAMGTAGKDWEVIVGQHEKQGFTR